MRMEELEDSRYIKSTDSVEKYLLGIIQEYFKNSNTALEGSKEFICFFFKCSVETTELAEHRL